MRPEILFPLFAPVSSLPGVGPRVAGLLEKLAGAHVVDLVWHLPTGIIDRRHAPKVGEARSGEVATITVQVDRHAPPQSPRHPYRVYCSDETGTIALVFFHARADWLRRSLPEGKTRVISGQVERFHEQVQITHPDHICRIDELDVLQAVEPVYPLTAGLSLKVLGKIVRAGLLRAPDMPEWQDVALLSRKGWPSWHEAVTTVHAPESDADLQPSAPSRLRLAYDELLANQLALALVRFKMRRTKGRCIAGNGERRQKAMAALPFRLTGSQEIAIKEVLTDMASETAMLRLLQGDVGSGKTVVALMAMLNAIEAGCQTAIMAPTEILARQHLSTIAPLAAAAGVRVGLLTGREKGKNRQAVLDDLFSGETGIVVGTHALFQEDVTFHDLGLAVIDEQHRFGVHQRLTLTRKGRAVDVLVMTATPIPRTLMLTAYGDMDVSRLTEKPAGRRPVTTIVKPLDALEEVTGAIGRAVTAGDRVYWVCPLVEESESLDLAAAEERHRELSARFGPRVGMVHGRMKGRDKDAAMDDFASGRTDILVATTVIEVGVDVRQASVMVVEHAERFGLAQLHQLRGRIGRGERASTCILLYAHPLGETARARLSVLRETDDGFRIAEEDLKLRGHGELLGTRQSGLPEFRLADLEWHEEMLAMARDDAALILSRDPELETPRGRALRVLLYLFERDAAVGLLRSG